MTLQIQRPSTRRVPIREAHLEFRLEEKRGRAPKIHALFGQYVHKSSPPIVVSKGLKSHIDLNFKSVGIKSPQPKKKKAESRMY